MLNKQWPINLLSLIVPIVSVERLFLFVYSFDGILIKSDMEERTVVFHFRCLLNLEIIWLSLSNTNVVLN